MNIERAMAGAVAVNELASIGLRFTYSGVL